jgi:phosphinothricin acetyltransferase
MREIRAMTPEDWPEVEEIYAEGIATGDATFETETPSWEAFDAGRLPRHRLVAIEDGVVAGWAALMPTSGRACYAGVVEHSVYVAESGRGRGVGRALLEALLTGADADGLWTIQTSIFPENAASLALHESVGFRVVGRRERIAQLAGVWRTRFSSNAGRKRQGVRLLYERGLWRQGTSWVRAAGSGSGGVRRSFLYRLLAGGPGDGMLAPVAHFSRGPSPRPSLTRRLPERRDDCG